MKTKNLTKLILGLAIIGLMGSAQAQFTAVNDQTSGPGTSPNATFYGAFGDPADKTGPLKNINTGANLPVTLTITSGGALLPDSLGGAPNTGTPLDIEFGGFVDWNGATGTNNVGMRSSGFVTYTLTGLDPAKSYVIIAGAVRGEASFANRWGLFELSGADGFTAAHSPGTLTTAEVGTITAAQVAINTGNNSEGLKAQWNDVSAGADGTIEILCRKYSGTVPGGSSSGLAGYALTALKVVDAVDSPVSIISDPANVLVNSGESATFSLAADGFPIEYQWYKNGAIIPGANGSTYTIPSASLVDSGAFYSVVVNNDFGPSQTSDTALLTVLSPPVAIVPWNQPYSYEITATDLGTGWKELDFSAATWPVGPGPLGFESSTIDPPLATTFSSHGDLTYYFRTEFVFDGLPTSIDLDIITHLDDGAVFWLNGVEVFRVGMNGNVGDAVPFNTPAGRTVGNASQEIVPPEDVLRAQGQLVTGTNVLAIESHQTNPTSSDIVMGTEWTATFATPTPLTITDQPEPTEIEELKNGTLTVGVDGVGASFVWFKDGVIIPGANAQTLRLDEVTLSDDGDYTVQVRNHVSRLTSQAAAVTVLVDTNAPTLVTADGSLNQTNITVSFSEKISPTMAEDIANYRLTTTGGGSFEISSASITNATNVILITEARMPGTNYLVVVNNIQDISPMANAIEPESMVPVATLLQLIRTTGSWDLYDPIVFFGDPAYPGDGWNDFGFVLDFYWGLNVQSLFYIATDVQEYPVPRGSSVSQGSITDYYRTTFDFNASPLGAVFKMQHVVDDGAVFYLNGEEFERYNMGLPGTPVDALDFSVGSVGTANFVEVENIPADRLMIGENLMAVEIHEEMANTQRDMTFALDFSVRINSLAEGPVLITQEPKDQIVNEGQPARVSFDGAGPLFFQWYLDDVAIPGGTNAAFLIPRATLSMSGNVYHVTASNDMDGAISETAVLTVIADEEPPVLLSAFTDTASASVKLSFSEPVDPATAASISRYSITNTGGFIGILSASVQDETNIIVNTGPAALSGSVIVVNGITDIAEARNPVAPNSAAIIGFQGMVFDWESPWRFDQTTGFTTLPPTDWNQPSFLDGGWEVGPGILGTEGNLTPPNNGNLPGIMTEFLNPGNGGPIAVYLRKTFNLPADPASVELFNLDIIRDDGFVLYLNGVEILRRNVPAGVLAFDTQATNHEANEIETESITGFVSGMNTLAVDLRQSSTGSSDSIWGAQLSIQVPSSIILPPPDACGALDIEFVNGDVRITWDGSTGCVLQSTDALAENPADTVWTTVNGATTPWTITNPTGNKYYRLSN